MNERILIANMPDLNYQLLDFGRGRKLERFGDIVVDRPCVAAMGQSAKQSMAQWHEQSGLRFDQRWIVNVKAREHVELTHWLWKSEVMQTATTITATLRPTPAGHLGIFPEHYQNFSRLLEIVGPASTGDEDIKVLNLFAYTGIGSLQCQAAGFDVTHVDAARPTIQWAKHNAELTQQHRDLEYSEPAETLPIRFIIDDAIAYCARQLRRGTRYSIVCLDPPAYGHGPKGNAWRLVRDLPKLMELMIELLSDHPVACLLAGHSPTQNDLSRSKWREQMSELFEHRQSYDANLVCGGWSQTERRTLPALVQRLENKCRPELAYPRGSGSASRNAHPGD